MSDYLGHLLQRSFTPTPEVKPQVPSLFEPKPAKENAELPLDFGEKNPPITDAGNDRTPSVARKPESTPRPSNSDPTSEFARATQSPRENNSVPREISPPIDFTAPEHKRETRSAATSMAKPAVASDQSNSAAIAPAQPPLRREAPTPANSEIRSATPRGNKITSPVVVDFHLDDSQRGYGNRRPSASPVATQPVMPADAKPPRALIPRTSLSPTSAPSREKADPRNHPPISPASALPPSINVTIGRVEIRATPPPAPAVRNTPRRESGMSLETYLQRRSGGSS